MRRASRWCAAVLALTGGHALAADHVDSPGATADPAADIADLYAFVSPEDPEKVVMVMTVSPFAGATSSFSDAVEYHFNVEQLVDGGQRRDIVCTFGADNTYTCNGPAGVAASGMVGGNPTMGDSIRTWAGLRDDPFFFDLEAFKHTTGIEPGDRKLCLVDGTNEGVDFFAGKNVLAIVVEVRRDVLWAGMQNPQLRIWASTVRMGG
jgi:hypothetical protein